jgi:plasmid replication initiation protein
LFLLCFCFCLLFIYIFVHSNLYRTFIVFNITLASRTNILKVTNHSQHYISITWQTFWKGRSIHNITLVLRDKHSENDVAFTLH